MGRLDKCAASLADAVEPPQRVLGWDARVPGGQGCVAGGVHHQLEPEALGILEPEPVAGARRADALALQAGLPEVERALGADAEGDRVHHPGARAAAARARVLEERDVGAGASGLVRVEEVVDGGIVLIDGLLHEPQPEHAHVEVDVPRRVAGDAGHVVDAFEPHRGSFRSVTAWTRPAAAGIVQAAGRGRRVPPV
jgi:hypothetical protein